MLFDGQNRTMKRTPDQEKWLEAMVFCDTMECEHRVAFVQTDDPEQKILAEWWEAQGKLCQSRVQRNIPYVEGYMPTR